MFVPNRDTDSSVLLCLHPFLVGIFFILLIGDVSSDAGSGSKTSQGRLYSVGLESVLCQVAGADAVADNVIG